MLAASGPGCGNPPIPTVGRADEGAMCEAALYLLPACPIKHGKRVVAENSVFLFLTKGAP